MKLFKKNNGAVTIFLVLILVPVIAVTTIFIDVSRMKLSEGVVYSAGDLALNTVLTQYDVELADYYGLMASCQTVDEFYEVAEGYFEACIVSQDIDPVQAKQWASDITSIFVEGDGDIVDLINVNLADTEVSITSPDNASLANSVMMKNQIMDFMKYRAPIELLNEASGLVSKFHGVSDSIKAMPAESEVQDKKDKYYDAENVLLQEALEAYEFLVQYEELNINGEKFSREFMENTFEDMGQLEQDFEKLHAQYVEYWCNTDVDHRKEFDSVKTLYHDERTVSDKDKYSGGDLKSAIKKCKNALEKFNEKKTALETIINGIDYAKYPISGSASASQEVNHTQYWIQMSDQIQSAYDDYIDALCDLGTAYNNMTHVFDNRDTEKRKDGTDEYGHTKYKDYDAADDEDYDSDHTNRDMYNEVKPGASSAITKATKSGDTIYDISVKMESYCDENYAYVNRSYADQQIKDAEANLVARYNLMVEAEEILKDLEKKLNSIIDDVEKYNETYGEWTGAVDRNKDVPSEFIDSHEEEIEDIEEERVDIDPDDVRALISRVNGIRELFKNYRLQIEAIEYRKHVIMAGSVVESSFAGITGIYNLYTFNTAATTQPGECAAPPVVKTDIPVLQAELDNYITSTFEITDDIDNIAEVTNANSPDMHEEGNRCDFDKWLHDKFDGKGLESKKTKGMLKKLKETLNGLKDSVLPGYTCQHLSDNEICEEDNLPSAGTGETAGIDAEKKDDAEEQMSESSDNVGKIFGGVDFSDLFVNGRDNIYATQYIMSMFSYETYELEGMFEMGREGASKNNVYEVKLPNGSTKVIEPAKDVAKSYYEDPSVVGDEESGWSNEKKTFTDNKTLTNKMINEVNNYSYSNEVEYILYGGKVESNRLKANATVFATRYALNVAPVFMKYMRDDVVRTIAANISGATAGVIPMPLVQAIICLGICAAETAVDMNYLKAGLPVLFVKGQEQLFIDFEVDPTSFSDSIKECKKYEGSMFTVGKKEIPDGIGMFHYSDYLSMFLFIGLCTNEDTIYLRTADVIQANMVHNADIEAYEESGFTMDAARTYFYLDSTIKVNPLMVSLPYAQEYGTGALDTSTWNTYTYQATRGY